MTEPNGNLRIEWVPVGSLKPNPANPRRHGDAIQKVAESIQHFGWRQPIVVSKRDMIIEAGHARWEAAKSLGLDEVPVLFFDDDPVVAAAFNIADNRARDFSEWDNDALASLLVSLQSEDALLTTGFTDADLAELIGDLQDPLEDDGFDVDGAQADAEAHSYVERGQIWLLGEHRLMCGDATDKGEVQALLQGEAPLLMTTDPPYGVELDHSWREKKFGHPASPRGGQILGDTQADWRDAWALWPAQVAYVWHSGMRACEVREGLEAAGYQVRQQIIWVKPALVLGLSAYHWRHEPCWYAVRKGKNANWRGDRTHTTVWEFDSPIRVSASGGPDDEQTMHPTQKPLGVYDIPIRNHTVPGDLICDPFLGSGTAIIAAEQLGRRCVAMELDPRWAQVSIERWQYLTGRAAEQVKVTPLTSRASKSKL